MANQAALVKAASARLGSAEPRVVPCAAQTSEQYRYVSHRPRPPPPPLLQLQRCPHNFPARASASAPLPLSLCAPAPLPPLLLLLLLSAARWSVRKEEAIQVSQLFQCLRCSLLPLRSRLSMQSRARRSPPGAAAWRLSNPWPDVPQLLQRGEREVAAGSGGARPGGGGGGGKGAGRAPARERLRRERPAVRLGSDARAKFAGRPSRTRCGSAG